jgi:integrase
VEGRRIEERDAFMTACTTLREKLIFGLALKLGLREQELMYLEPREFDFEAGMVTIPSKSASGFEIKDKDERVLPVPQELLGDVQAYVKVNPGIRWLTGRDRDPGGHLLRLAQRIQESKAEKCRL